ncbi:TIGR03759 family integrating conjugative element protein [Sedimenticola selenatireducens]|uniref:TIGR03759 family integrating conjugative element protein n=1 Tax=Sedimenticola selenatireducens TaxID=191960 RepID=UPI0006845273|nr:TIGR03759 family integrating conjugative element protein [Sedimenticola selenatireducens]
MANVQMSSHMKPAILAFALVASYPIVAADLSQFLINETGQTRSSTAANDISETDMAHAQLWDLSETEWRRYQQLMRGIRGSISPSTISPIEVLGIHARDEVERQQYAEAWARAMREDVDRILSFQRAYDAAVKHLYPNEPVIDIGRLPGKSVETSALQSSDRLLFFTRPACPVCDVLLNKLLQRIGEVRGIDIYLTELTLGDDAAVRDWASSHRIESEWVRSRRVTLNHDGGALDSLTNGQGKVPYLLRRRGEDLSQLRASEL